MSYACHENNVLFLPFLGTVGGLRDLWGRDKLDSRGGVVVGGAAQELGRGRRLRGRRARLQRRRGRRQGERLRLIVRGLGGVERVVPAIITLVITRSTFTSLEKEL